MPPKQCPECGRFLRNDFVTGLAQAPAPCPRCGTELTDELLGANGDAVVAEPVAAAPVETAAAQEAEASVRPPDVDTSEVAAEPAPQDEVVVDVTDDALSVRPPDVPSPALQGWDPDGYRPATLDDVRAQDRTPQFAAIGAAGGVVAGLLFLSERRAKGALLGALAGALAGFAAGRLTDQP